MPYEHTAAHHWPLSRIITWWWHTHIIHFISLNSNTKDPMSQSVSDPSWLAPPTPALYILWWMTRHVTPSTDISLIDYLTLATTFTYTPMVVTSYCESLPLLHILHKWQPHHTFDSASLLTLTLLHSDDNMGFVVVGWMWPACEEPYI